MNLRFNAIIDFLIENNIPYEVHGNNAKENLVVASIFYPSEGGFYYWTGDNFQLNDSNAVVLTNQKSLIEQSHVIILIDGEPQEVYYRILDYYFKYRSTGEISDQSIIHRNAKLGTNVQIDSFSILEDCIIEDNVIIGSSCKIHSNSVISKNTIVESGTIIGAQGVAWVWSHKSEERIIQPQLGGVIIEKNCFIGAQTVIVRGSLNENSVIGDHTIMAPGGRIGHGTIIGKYVHFANGVITGGNSRIGDYSFIGSGAVLRPKVSICERTIVGAGSVVVKDQDIPGMTLMGVPAKAFETKQYPAGMPKPKRN